MKRIICLVITFNLFLNLTYSQRLPYALWGVKLAPIISSVNKFEDFSFGVSTGLVCDLQVVEDIFSIYSEVNYTQFSSNINNEMLKFRTLDIPLSCKLEFFANAFYFRVGARTQFILNAKNSFPLLNNSLVFGLGREFYPRGWKDPYFVSITYDYGLTDLVLDDSFISRNTFIALNIGRKFFPKN